MSHSANEVGHVGMATGEDSVVHACGDEGVIETDLSRFKADNRGIRRLVQHYDDLPTIICPSTDPVEWSIDFPTLPRRICRAGLSLFVTLPFFCG